jgi:molecular chaperone Hsp33
MGDNLVRSISKEAGIRVIVAVTTDATREAIRRHETTPTATVALGRALTAAALMGALLRVRHRVALKFDGNGPLGKLLAESDSYGRIRGYVAHPKTEVERDEFGRIDVATALGTGQLIVVKDVRLSSLVEGIVALQPSEIGDDFQHYLTNSEQTPSVVQLDTVLDDEGNVAMSGGILIQAVGDTNQIIVADMAERLEEMPPITQLLLNGRDPDDIIGTLFGEISHEILETRNVDFVCGCSRERSEKALISLGADELASLIEEGQAIIDCHFCHRQFVFTKADLEAILADAF